MTSRYIIAATNELDGCLQYFVIDRSRDVVILRTDSLPFAQRVKRDLNDG